jgi:cytochrome c biogenesis protein CcmG, thiol:disulfide interchange protein DsbE
MVASTPANRTTVALAALGVALLAFGMVVSADAPPRKGAPAPAFTLPVVANGHGTLTLASLKGHPVYLNFFASWCQPCKEEASSIAALSKQYAPEHVVVIGIDELEQAQAAKEFAERYHLPYSIALDQSGEVGGTYGLIGLPLHVFIGSNGTIAAYRVGEMSKSQIQDELSKLGSAH